MMGNTVQKGLWLDPRAKLFLILMCVLSSMFAPSLAYQFALVLLIAILGVLCGKWKYSIKGVCFYAVVCVLTVWIMATMTGTLRSLGCSIKFMPVGCWQGLSCLQRRSASFYPP